LIKAPLKVKKGKQAMKTCPICGTKNFDTYTICEKCHNPLSPSFTGTAFGASTQTAEPAASSYIQAPRASQNRRLSFVAKVLLIISTAYYGLLFLISFGLWIASIFSTVKVVNSTLLLFVSMLIGTTLIIVDVSTKLSHVRNFYNRKRDAFVPIACVLFVASLLLIALMVFALYSRQVIPELDFDDAEYRLEDKDYSVVIDDENALGISVLMANKENDDYIRIMEYDTEEMAKIVYNKLKIKHESEKEILELEIQRLEYILENYDEELDSEREDSCKSRIKDLKKELKEAEEVVVGKKGRFVWQGTRQAVEDSTGYEQLK
jgi:hypothetical protein